MKKIFILILVTSFIFTQSRDCSEIENLNECYDMGCEWIILYEEVGNELILTEECVDADDGGDCSGLSEDECSIFEGCQWMDSDNIPGGGSCVENEENNDCDPDLTCATVLTCYEGLLYPTSCGPENCDDPIGECDDNYEGCFENGEWYGYGQELFISDCEYLECTPNGWTGPFTLDNNNCYDGNVECSDLTQDECEGSNNCEWISDSDNPNSWGSCVENEDNDDGPPECLDDCPGIEDINPNQNPYETCDWIISYFGLDPGFSSCVEDCSDETMIEIYEIVEACYECLENENIDCSDIFNDDDSNQENCEELNYPDCSASENCEWIITNSSGGYSCAEINDENHCADLSVDECVGNPDCQPNYNATGEYEGCMESNSQPNFGFLYGHVEYIYGDVVDFVPYAQLYIESLPSNSDMYYFEVMTDMYGYYQIQLPVGSYIVTAFANDEMLTQDVQITPNIETELNFLIGEGYGPWYPYANLLLGSTQGSPGTDVAMPLYLSSPEFVGGVQFTIQPGIQNAISPILIESINPCFSANYNTIDNGQIIGILFSLEGCSYPPEEMLHIGDIIFNINEDVVNGTVVPLNFNSTIVSDPNGNEIPSYGEGNDIVIGVQGDINGDSEINVLDVVVAINFVLYVDEPTESEFWASDMNSDSMINVLDIVQLVNLILND